MARACNLSDRPKNGEPLDSALEVKYLPFKTKTVSQNPELNGLDFNLIKNADQSVDLLPSTDGAWGKYKQRDLFNLIEETYQGALSEAMKWLPESFLMDFGKKKARPDVLDTAQLKEMLDEVGLGLEDKNESQSLIMANKLFLENGEDYHLTELEKVKLKQISDLEGNFDFDEASKLFKQGYDNNKYENDIKKIIFGLITNNLLDEDNLSEIKHVPRDFLELLAERKINVKQANQIFGIVQEINDSIWEFLYINIDERGFWHDAEDRDPMLKESKLFTKKIFDRKNNTLASQDSLDGISDKISSISDTIKKVYSKVFLPQLLIFLDQRDLSEEYMLGILDLSQDLVLNHLIANKSLFDIAALSDRFHEQAYGQRNILNKIEAPLRKLKIEENKDEIQTEARKWPSLLSTPWHDPETGLSIVPLLSIVDLEEESDQLNHCVGDNEDYQNECKARRSVILSLRNDNQESLSTMQFRLSTFSGTNSDHHQSKRLNIPVSSGHQQISLVQHRGDSDRKPPAICLKAEKNFLKALLEGKAPIDETIFFISKDEKDEKEKNSFDRLIEAVGFDPFRNPGVAEELWRYFSGDTVEYQKNEDNSYKKDEKGKRIPVLVQKYKKENGRFLRDQDGNKIPEMKQGENGKLEPVLVPKQQYPELAPYKNPDQHDEQDDETGEWLNAPTNKNIRMLSNGKSEQTAQEFWAPVFSEIEKQLEAL